MSGVFRNIDPHPLTARRVVPPSLVRGEDTLARGRGGGGGGVNSSEDARHCSVLNICKYFVVYSISRGLNFVLLSTHGDHPQLPPAWKSPAAQREETISWRWGRYCDRTRDTPWSISG
jgi:hypothetical protein